MKAKEKIIEILNEYSYYVGDRHENDLTVIGDLYFDELADDIVTIFNETTDLVEQRDEFVFYMVTQCCKEGPITSQNYCPNCGKKIVHSEKI